MTMKLVGDRPPRYDKKTPPLHVGLGPSDATRACERVPLAIVRAPGSVGQDRLKLWHLPSDPDLFVIRRSQTTEEEKHIVTMKLAGDRPPHYDKKTLPPT